MAISETIDSFTPIKQESLKTTLRDEMGCHEPSCFLELKISGGSISVAAVLTIPDDAPDGVDAAALAASVETAATQLVAQNPSALSASLGVPVESTAPVTVQTGVVVPLVVAPPPPSPPPSPQSPPPPSTPEQTDAGGDSMIIIIAAAGGSVALIAVVIALRCYTKRMPAEDTNKALSSKAPTHMMAGPIDPALV